MSQPLLRNFKIDNVRQQLEVSERIREVADVHLQATIIATTRNVQQRVLGSRVRDRQPRRAQQQSLDLAQRLLADNEKRVQIGTMAPIDIVEAQSEVARNEEAVIVAEAAIKQAEDRLRALILDPGTPDFWTVTLEPTDTAPNSAQRRSTSTARCSARSRTGPTCCRSKNNLQQNDVNIRYYKNQALPEVNAPASYGRRRWAARSWSR